MCVYIYYTHKKIYSLTLICKCHTNVLRSAEWKHEFKLKCTRLLNKTITLPVPYVFFSAAAQMSNLTHSVTDCPSLTSYRNNHVLRRENRSDIKQNNVEEKNNVKSTVNALSFYCFRIND